MIIVEGWVRVAPGELDRLRPALAAMIAASRAEAGCQTYAYSSDVLEADLLRITERWDDEAALAAHFATPHMAALTAAMAGAPILGASVKAYSGEVVRTLLGN